MKQDRRLKKEQWVIQALSSNGEWHTISEFWIDPGIGAGSGAPMKPRSLAKCIPHAKIMMHKGVTLGEYQYRLLNTQNEKETIPTEIL